MYIGQLRLKMVQWGMEVVIIKNSQPEKKKKHDREEWVEPRLQVVESETTEISEDEICIINSILEEQNGEGIT
jgi:hypothetical protein